MTAYLVAAFYAAAINAVFVALCAIEPLFTTPDERGHG